MANNKGHNKRSNITSVISDERIKNNPITTSLLIVIILLLFYIVQTQGFSGWGVSIQPPINKNKETEKHAETHEKNSSISITEQASANSSIKINKTDVSGVVEIMSETVAGKKTSLNMPYNPSLRICEFNRDFQWVDSNKPGKCSFLRIKNLDPYNHGGKNFESWCMLIGTVGDRKIQKAEDSLNRLLVISKTAMNDLVPFLTAEFPKRMEASIQLMSEEEVTQGFGARERDEVLTTYKNYCSEV